MRRHVIFSTLALVGVVAVAACSGSSDHKKSTSAVASPGAAKRSGSGGLGDESLGGPTANSPASRDHTNLPVDLANDKRPDGQQVIHTASVSMQAKDVDAALRQITADVRAAGGEVFAANANLTDGPDRTIRAVFKVPPARFDAVMQQLGSAGKIVQSETSTDDVTGQVVDLDARLAAARTSVARLQELLAHSGNVTDLLQVEQELSQRESQVESLDGQLQALRKQVDLATIAVNLSPVPPAAAAASPSHHIPGFLAGLRTGAAAFANTALVAVTGLGFLLPFLVLALLVGFPVRRALRRRRTPAAEAA